MCQCLLRCPLIYLTDTDTQSQLVGSENLYSVLARQLTEAPHQNRYIWWLDKMVDFVCQYLLRCPYKQSWKIVNVLYHQEGIETSLGEEASEEPRARERRHSIVTLITIQHMPQVHFRDPNIHCI